MTAQFLQRVQSYHAYVCSVTGQQMSLGTVFDEVAL